MTFTKKQARSAAAIGTVFVGFALSPVYGVIFAFVMFSLLTC